MLDSVSISPMEDSCCEAPFIWLVHPISGVGDCSDSRTRGWKYASGWQHSRSCNGGSKGGRWETSGRDVRCFWQHRIEIRAVHVVEFVSEGIHLPGKGFGG